MSWHRLQPRVEKTCDCIPLQHNSYYIINYIIMNLVSGNDDNMIVLIAILPIWQVAYVVGGCCFAVLSCYSFVDFTGC